MEPHEDVDRAIEALERKARSLGQGRQDWKELWADVKGAGGALRQTRYPTPEARNVARERFERAVVTIRAKQTDYFEQLKERKEHSSTHVGHLQRLADAARPDDALAGFFLFVATGGVSFVVEKAADLVFGETDKALEELRRRSKCLRDAWSYLGEHKQEILGSHKSEVFVLLKEVQAELDRDWASYKEYKHQRWEARQAEKRAKHAEWEAKQERWRTNQIAWIEKQETGIDRLEAVLSRKHEHLSKLLGDYATAWSDGYRDRVGGWISEERQAIADVERKLEDARDRLREAIEKLRN